MLSETQISGTALPAFDRIRAGDVEPAIRELLQRSRGEVATLEGQPHPTFENTVLPLEQLAHRLSRTWSPISHLNGVLNSDELRASYNACLPLLSNYWTDLAQSEALYQESLRYDRQARWWLFGGETALAGAAAMFVWELTRHTPKPDNIPFEPEVRSLPNATGVGLKVEF